MTDISQPPVITAPDLGSRFLVAEVTGRVLHLRVNRPERRNSYTQDMYRGLKRAAIWADEQPELDAVCLTGTDAWFGAGGDMAGNAEDTDALNSRMGSDRALPVPPHRAVLEALGGQDQRAVRRRRHGSRPALRHRRRLRPARFRVPELLRGIPDPFMSARLVHAVGLARARYLFFTADEISADEAAVMGLVGKVVPHDQLDAEVERVLGAVGRTGPIARAAIKRDLNRRLPPHDTDLMRKSIGTPEMVEGMRAFVEKREVNWPR